MHEALCRPSGTTLDTCMPRDGPPITQRTSGLALRIIQMIELTSPFLLSRRKRLSGNRVHCGCPCFETRPSDAPQHEEVFDGIEKIPHPEEAAHGSALCAARGQALQLSRRYSVAGQAE